MKYIFLATLLLAGCTPEKDGRDFTWTIVKSPRTGRCYEVASVMLGTQYGVMAMGEIPCSEMERAR